MCGEAIGCFQGRLKGRHAVTVTGHDLLDGFSHDQFVVDEEKPAPVARCGRPLFKNGPGLGRPGGEGGTVDLESGAIAGAESTMITILPSPSFMACQELVQKFNRDW